MWETRYVVAGPDVRLSHVIGIRVIGAVGHKRRLEGGIQIGVIEAEAYGFVVGIQAKFQTLSQCVANVGEVTHV